MHNHIQNNTQHQFRIHGGDKRGSNYLMYVAIGLLPIVGALIWFLGDLGFWIGFGGYAVSLAACMGWMGSGKAERYEILIDTDERTISATDRVLGVQLWEDDLNPDWIRTSQIQVIISGETYRHPALVYSEEPLDLVIDSVPTSTRTLLGLGEHSSIQAVHQLFEGIFAVSIPAPEA